MLKCFNLISESLYFTIVLLKIPIMDKDGFSLILFYFILLQQIFDWEQMQKKGKTQFWILFLFNGSISLSVK